MSELALPAIADRKASTPRKVTGRLKRALDLMVWDCKTDNEAAVETGLTIQAIRFALKQPAARSYYRDQLVVLRERESSRNIHALVSVRDGTNQMARVAAVKALEQIGDETPARSMGSVSLPGLVIQVINNAPLSTQQQHLPSEGSISGPQVIEHERQSDE